MINPYKLVVISILLCLVFAKVFGQDKFLTRSYLIDDSLVTLKYIEQFYDLEKDNFCYYPSSENDEKGIKQFLDEHYQKFSLLHIESDSLLIFDGKQCPGYESGWVIVYKSEKGKLNPILSKDGTIACLENEFLTIYNYPCCAMITHVLNTYNLKSGKLEGRSHVFFSIEQSDFFDIENFRRTNSRSEKFTIKEQREIRWEANTNKPFFPSFPCNNEQTNIIALLNRSSSGSLLKYNEDETWALVQFLSTSTQEMFCPINFEKENIESSIYYIYGWVPLKK